MNGDTHDTHKTGLNVMSFCYATFHEIKQRLLLWTQSGASSLANDILLYITLSQTRLALINREPSCLECLLINALEMVHGVIRKFDHTETCEEHSNRCILEIEIQ
jgi:hypothetical protein